MATNEWGTGYGCACKADDARICIVLRYGEDTDGEPCVCLCHEWRKDAYREDVYDDTEFAAPNAQIERRACASAPMKGST